MGRKGDGRVYEFVEALIEIGVRELQASLSIPEEQATAAMREIAHGICFQFARSYMYVPAALEFELSSRDEEIWRKYGEDGPPVTRADGSTYPGAKKYTAQRVQDLANEYNVTLQQLYNIVRMMRRREVKRRQASLPGFDEPQS